MKEALEYLQSFVSIVFMLFGITGVSYHLFKDEGWIGTILGSVWDAAIRYPLLVFPIIIGAVLLGMMWKQQRGVHGSTSKLPDLVIYGLMAAGAVFIGRWFLYGTL